MSEKKLRIAIDQDEVIANYRLKAVDYYNQINNANIKIDETANLDKETSIKLYDFMDLENFCRDLQVIENSQEVIFELSKKYDIFIVSAGTLRPKTMNDKFEWIKEHFSFIDIRNIVFCGDKSIILADYLIDDIPYNLENFKGQGILFSTPYNQTFHGYTRVNNWVQVAEMFL